MDWIESMIAFLTYFINIAYHTWSFHYLRGGGLKGKAPSCLINKTAWAVYAGLLSLPFGWKAALAVGVGLRIFAVDGRQHDGLIKKGKERLKGILKQFIRDSYSLFPLFILITVAQTIAYSDSYIYLAYVLLFKPIIYSLLSGFILCLMQPFTNIALKQGLGHAEILEGFTLGCLILFNVL